MTNQCGEVSPSFSFEEAGVKLEAVESVSPDGFPLDLPGGHAEVVQESTTEGDGRRVEQEAAVKAVLAPISEEEEEEDRLNKKKFERLESGLSRSGREVRKSRISR